MSRVPPPLAHADPSARNIKVQSIAGLAPDAAREKKSSVRHIGVAGPQVAQASVAGFGPFLQRQKFVLALAVAVAFVTGSVVIAVSPAKYRSFARVIVESSTPALVPSGAPRTANLRDTDNQRYIILSQAVLAETVSRGHLAESALFGNAQPGLIGRLWDTFARPTAVQDRDDRAVAALADAVDVMPGDRDGLVDIVVTTRDAKVSADVANLIAKIYLEREQDSKLQAASRAGGAFDQRAITLAREAQRAEDELATFRLSNNLDTAATGQLPDDRQTDPTKRLANAKARTTAVQARLAELEHCLKAKLEPAQLPEAVAQIPAIAGLRAQYGQLVQQEASYLTQLGPRHPALVQVHAQIQDMRARIAAELARLVQTGRSDLASAKSFEATLARSADGTDDSGNSAIATRLHELERTAEAKKALYQSVLARQKEFEQRQVIEPGTMRIIADAVPATQSIGSSIPLVLGAALMFGLAAGTGFGFLREVTARSPRNVGELEALLGAPFLGLFVDSPAGPKEVRAAPKGPPDATEMLVRLDEDGPDARIIGIVGLHVGDVPPRLFAEIAVAGKAQRRIVGFVSCDKAPTGPTPRIEAPLGSREPAAPAITPLADLLAPARGSLALPHLRRALRDHAFGMDLLFFAMPAIDDVGMPPELLDAADAIVLAIAEGDIAYAKIGRLKDFVAKARTPLAGFFVIGKRPG